MTHFLNSLKLSQPGVSHNGPEDGGQVAEGHKDVVDGGGQVIVPEQEVLEVQHEYSCGQVGEILLISQCNTIRLHRVSSKTYLVMLCMKHQVAEK